MAESLSGEKVLETSVVMTLDVTGHPCPIPILKTRKALAGLAVGAILEVLADDPISREDMAALCHATGHELLSTEVSEAGSGTQGLDTYRFLIRKLSPI